MRLHAAASLLMFLAPALSHAGVLLERAHSSGEIVPEMSSSAVCTITDTGELETDYTAGGYLRSHRVQQLQISLTALRTTIAEAQKGELTSVEPFPVDGPSLRYRALRHFADGRDVEVVLWEENGATGRKQVNTSPAATRLRLFIDMNCGPLN